MIPSGLAYLSIRENQFTGTLPDITMSTALEFLDGRNNNFEVLNKEEKKKFLDLLIFKFFHRELFQDHCLQL